MVVLDAGLSTSPVGGPCVESRRKADDLIMVCEMKEVAGDLHAALLCCNQAACTYVWLIVSVSLISSGQV